MAKLKHKKTAFSYIAKRKFIDDRRLPFCPDVGLRNLVDHLKFFGHVAIAAENAPVNTSDDYAFLGWARRHNLIWITRDWERAKRMLHEGLMYTRPGILVIHSPSGDAADLRDGLDLFLARTLRYDQVWGRVFYLSHGAFHVYEADGTRTRAIDV